VTRNEDILFPKERRSASSDAALRAEIKRVAKMTIEERMREALSLGRRLAGIQSQTGAKGR
jgi:hypothetical protein